MTGLAHIGHTELGGVWFFHEGVTYSADSEATATARSLVGTYRTAGRRSEC